MANYFDHLLDTPTYTVAQTAKRFEPSTVLWAFHAIQPSTLCSKKSDAKVQITAYLIRIKYPLSGFKYHLSGVMRILKKIHRIF